MPHQVSAQTIEALRATLAQVEQMSDFAPDDPSLITLKSILLQRIAELQAVGEAAAMQQAEQLAPESAVTSYPTPTQQPASALAINLAVSLLAENPTARPFEPAAMAAVAPPTTPMSLPDPIRPPPEARPVPAAIDEAQIDRTQERAIGTRNDS